MQQTDSDQQDAGAVLTCDRVWRRDLTNALAPFGLTIQWCRRNETIPGSFWGEPEAGRIGPVLYLRPDTPVHSALHEASHYICMDVVRRDRDDIDAGGTALEECAVCYLQICLADALPGVGRSRMLEDMDRWGYSFRLGSARAWFERDAEDAREFLVRRGVFDAEGRLVRSAAVNR